MQQEPGLRRNPSLAKITRPHLPEIVARERLFQLLDNNRQYPVVWITGLAGAGKTTLAASYLQARQIPSIWYQIDEGDADPATFFYYLGLAAKKAAPQYRRSLPLLTPEYALGTQTFAKRYFESLFERMKQPSVLVLDNYQEARHDALLHDLIANVLTDIPHGTQVYVISRSEPPSPFVRIQANSLMAVMDSEQLLLTPEELTEIMGLHCAAQPSQEMVQLVSDKSRGWAAGVVLLCQAIRMEAIDPGMRKIPSMEKMFDYFSNELFMRVDASLQDFLIKTAFMRTITPGDAEELSGHSNSDEILSRLNRRNFFIEKRSHPELTYQYHPLFRDFLLSHAHRFFSSGDISLLQRNSAHLLEQSGHVEDAAALYREAGEWEGFHNLILRHAPALMQQGRNRTLSGWLAQLPTDMIEKDPWLLYWRGMSAMPFDPAASNADLERAFSLFTKRTDRAGIFLAWSGVVDSILLQFDRFGRFDHWFKVLQQVLKTNKEFPSQEIELRVALSMFSALNLRKANHPDALKWRERMLSLADRSGDVNLHMIAAFHAGWHELCIGNPDRSALIIRPFEKILIQKQSTPLTRIMIMMLASIHCWLQGRNEECQKIASDALRTADESGVHVWDHQILGSAATSALSIGDAERSEELLQRMEKGLPWTGALGKSYYYYLASWNALMQNDYCAAQEYANIGIEYVERAESKFSLIVNYLGTAAIHHEKKNYNESEYQFKRAQRVAEEMNSPAGLFMCNLAAAQFAFDRKKEAEGRNALRRAMTIGREQGYMNMYCWRPDVMARLCVKALENSIEPEYVGELIRRRNLMPENPPLDVDAWPWPIKITTLGRFEVLRDGKPLEFSRKVQKKPLQLLKALVAAGGKEVRQDRLTYLLWPDAQGDAGHKSLGSTVIRLRRLIGMADAIVVREGSISLDSRSCWVDASAFEHLLEQAREARKRAKASLSIRLLHKALELYTGPFLADDPDPWSVSLREKLRSTFLRSIDDLGMCMEQSRAYQEALLIYQRGLEVDDLAEPYYQRMMVCYRKLGRCAEALSVYNHCRKTLAVYDVSPSPDTEAIRDSLRRQE
jgi:ATP/maltotriose-dependent transcriptional regulator MalT/DNA-binding SARP family transcriptional activator